MDQKQSDTRQFGDGMKLTARRKRKGETEEEYRKAFIESMEQIIVREFPKPAPSTTDCKSQACDVTLPTPEEDFNLDDFFNPVDFFTQDSRSFQQVTSCPGSLQPVDLTESKARLAGTPPKIGPLSRTGTELKKYKKTSGAADGAGERYECKMLAIVFLRMLAARCDFELASNMDDADKFDDIVVWQRKHSVERWTVTCIQLKHKGKNKTLSKANFVALDGDFSFVKYCSSYLAIKQNGVIQRDSPDVKYIIYTNASVDVDLVTQRESVELFATGGQAVSFETDGQVYRELCDWVDFKMLVTELLDEVDGLSDEDVITKIIKDKLESVVYLNKAVMSMKDTVLKEPTLNNIRDQLKKLQVVSTKEEYASFLSELRLYTNQAHESELDAMINEEIAKVWTCGDDGEISVMINNLKDEVQAWWQNDKFCLTQESQLWRRVVKLRTEVLSKSTVDRLTKAGVEYEERCLQIVYNEIECREGIFNLRVDSKTAASSLKVHQALVKFGYQDLNVLHVNVEALLDREVDVLSAWSTRWCPVLVVECDEELDHKQAERIFETILKVIQGTETEKLLVLIAPELHRLNCLLSRAKSYTHFNDNLAWSDLMDATKEKIYSRRVFLNESESCLTLRDAVGTDKDFVKRLGMDEISQLLSGEIHCGQTLDEDSKYFVTRRLQKSVPFAVNSVLDVSDKVVLLVAEPGMGKSTLFTHLAKSAKVEGNATWVVHVKLNDCVKHLKTMNVANFNRNEVDKFFEQTTFSVGNNVERLLFGLLERNLVVLVDGVDEVCPHYEKEVFLLLSFLKEMEIRQLWVASRRVLQEKLENSLNIDTLFLAPFSDVDQADFFNKFWAANVPSASPEECKTATGKLLTWLTDSFGKENTILGVPLMNEMIAEKFQKEIFSKDQAHRNGAFKPDQRLDVMDLYDSFLKMKFDLYCEEKKNVQHRDVSSNLDEEELSLERLNYTHRLAALRVLLSPEEFSSLQCDGQENLQRDLDAYLQKVSGGNEKTGIIENVIDGVPKFVHRTFAEFFVGSWLAENFKRNRDLVERITFDPAFKVVNEMFSRSLAKGHPVHVAVLNRSVDETKRALGSQSEPIKVDALDKGGRTPLHLAVIFSATDSHLLWSDVMKCLVQEHKASVDLADMVLGWRPLQYAVRFNAWEALQVIYSKDNLLSASLSKPGDQLMLDAARYSSVRVVRFLAEECGGNLDCRGMNGETMVHAAAKGGDVEILKYLKAKGLALGVVDSLKNTALRYSSPRALPYLIENGLDLERVNARKLTPLQDAAQDGDYDVMAALLDNKASYEVRESDDKMAAQCNAALLCSAFAGSLESVQKLVQLGATVKHQNKKNDTAATVAMRRKHFDMAYWLLAQECSNGDTPLGLACQEGKLEVVTFILSRGDDIDGGNRYGETPMLLALKSGHMDVAKLLIAKGASVHNSRGAKPLEIAARRKNLDMMKLLLEKGADVECVDREGLTLLHKATRDENNEAVKLLLQNGANLDCRDKKGCTPLFDTIIYSHIDMTKLLLDSGANVECRDNEGRTPLQIAAHYNKPDKVKLLLMHGADLDCCDFRGRTPLYNAAQEGDLGVVEMLLKVGANVNCADEEGSTPLSYAVNEGQLELVEMLLEKGRKAVGRDGTHQDGCDTVKLLLEKEASVASDDGEPRWGTPLYHATTHCRYSVVKLLLAKGANAEYRDSAGKTPLHQATLSGHKRMIKTLKEYGANVECGDNDGKTPLHYAVLHRKYDVVKLLLKNGANVNCCDKVGRTPLHIAALGGDGRMVKLLVASGANVKCLDSEGRTPFNDAELSPAFEKIKTLLEVGLTDEVT